MFPFGENQGGFFEEVNGRIVNSAVISLQDGKFLVEDAGGGVYTILRVNRLVAERLERPFELVLPGDLKQKLQSARKGACADKPPK